MGNDKSGQETQLVTLCMEGEDLEEIDELMEKGEFDSRTDAILTAMDEHLESGDSDYYGFDELGRMTVKMPKDMIEGIDEKVDEGLYSSRSEFIREAARRDYRRFQEDFHPDTDYDLMLETAAEVRDSWEERKGGLKPYQEESLEKHIMMLRHFKNKKEL